MVGRGRRPEPPEHVSGGAGSGGGPSGLLGGVLLSLGLEALVKLGGVVVEAIADGAAGGRERRMAKRCPVCDERRDAHEGNRLSTLKKPGRGWVDGIPCDELRDGKAHEKSLTPDQWREDCPVCYQGRGMHVFGRMPGEVFIDGTGIVDCGKWTAMRGEE